VFLGTEWYHPIDGGPSLSGIIGLVFLPLVSAFLITLPTPAQEGESEALGKMHFSVKRIPVSFWKLCVAVFVFAIVTSVVRGLATHFEAPGTILIYSNLLMLFRLLFAVAFLYFTFRAVRRINFGKLYLVLMVGISIAVTLASSMQLYNGGFFTLFVGFSLDVFDILLWCMLAFIAHQSRASYLVVFGFGRGAFTLGGVIGWMIGAWLVPMITSAFWISLLFVLLATLVLVCAVLVFSEKDFDRLFSSILESELNLEDLAYQIGTGMGQNDKDDNFERTRPYAEACKNVAATFHLTEREQDIFELLAVGRGSEGIAERLHISSNTVRTHTQNIYAKLGVHSRHELMTLVESTKDNTIPANK
jgi:DNA-binding CsgD family transcriptional regulator